MIAACKDTARAWGKLPKKARSLAADRFVDFKNPIGRDDEWRRRTCENIRTGAVLEEKCREWKTFLFLAGLNPSDVLWARLQSRMILNAAGGVLENGGMCLDRISGVPYIPGSAVKGCARRWAIQALAEADAKVKPSLMKDLALIFGWGDQDWIGGRNDKNQRRSDFEYACGPDWQNVREKVASELLLFLGRRVNPEKPAWKQLPHYAGSVCFLPSYPLQDPGIDLDIVCCHHKEYYGNPEAQKAPDTESPEPIVFPVVSCAKTPVFAFALLPLRSCSAEYAAKARQWLKTGLETFGIGGKTHAGYGWFQDCSEETAERFLADQKKEQEEQLRRKTQEEEQKRLERERAFKKAQESMSPSEKVAAMDGELFRQRMLEFPRQEASIQMELVKALSGERSDFWAQIKGLTQTGKKKDKERWNPIVQSVYALAKQANPRIKMP